MTQALAAFRASQLRFLAPYTRMISSTPFWSLVAAEAPEPAQNGTPGSHTSSPPTPLSKQATSFTPVLTSREVGLPSITNFVATAVHRLVLLATNLRRVSANEAYVRRVLQEHVGLDPLDLDLLYVHHPEIFRLSVRHSIDPVVGYLRSQGLTGSALSHVLARSPRILSVSVEDHLVPLCTILKQQLGNKGVGLIVRHPPLAEMPAEMVEEGVVALHGAGASQEESTLLLWRYPELFMKLAEAVKQQKNAQNERNSQLGSRIIASWNDTSVYSPENSSRWNTGGYEESEEPENSLAGHLEQVTAALSVLKLAGSSGNTFLRGEKSVSLGVSMAERELRRAIEALSQG